MTAAVTELFQRVLELSLGTGLVAAALLLLRPLLRRRYPARLLCWVWVVLAVRLLAPWPVSLPRLNTAVRVPEPALSVDLPVRFGPAAEAPAVDPGIILSGQLPMEVLPELEGRGRTAVERAVVMDGWTVVASVWLAGCGVWAFLNFVPCLTFRRRVRRWSAPETDPAVLDQFGALRDELGGKNVRLLRCRAVGSPMAIGFFRPVLLLPEADYGPAALDAVFRHELSHIRRGHLWCKLLLLLCRTVHWFNPLVWLMVRRAEGDLELSCDEAAVRGMNQAQRTGYGRAVLDAVEADGKRSAPLTTCFRGGRRSMMERLRALVDTEGKKRGVTVLVLAAAAAVVCAGLFSVSGESSVLTLDRDTFRGSPAVLEAVWRNEGAVTMEYGAPFWLERRTVMGWQKLTTAPESAFYLVDLSVEPGESERTSYDIAGYYGVLEPGVYRLCAHYGERAELIGAEQIKGRERTARVTFTVVEGPDRALDAGAYRMELPEGVSWKYDGPEDAAVPGVRLYRDGEEAGYAAYLPVTELPQELVDPLFYGEGLETLPNGMSGLLEEDGNVYALVGFEVLHLYFGPALTEGERTAMLASLRVGRVVSETAEGRMVTYFDSEAGYQDGGWLCLWNGEGWQETSGLTTAFLEEPVEVAGPASWSPDGSRVAVTLRSQEMTTFHIVPLREATDFQVLKKEGRPLDAPFRASGWDLGYTLAEEPHAEFVPLGWSGDGQRLQFSYAWDDTEGVRRSGTAWYWPDVMIQYRAPGGPGVDVTGVHFISGAATQGAPRLELGQAVYRGSPGYLSAVVCNDSEGTISFSSSALVVERWDGERWLMVRHPWEDPGSTDYTAGPGERRDMGWQVSAPYGGLYRVGLDYTDEKSGGSGRMSAVFLAQGRSVWWSEEFDGGTVSLEDWDGVLKLVLERNGVLTVLRTLDYGADHDYFPYVGAEPFENVMGRDGFKLVVPVGMASTAIDYYTLDETGAPLCIGRCGNTSYELDLDGDGTNELLTNYGTMGYAEVYAWVDGGPKAADVKWAAAEKLGLEPDEASLRFERQAEDGSMVFHAERAGPEGDDLGAVRVSFRELEFQPFDPPETGPVG